MTRKLDSVLTMVLVSCALLTTGLVVHREVRREAWSADNDNTPTYIESWKTILSSGRRIGLEAAPVQLIEFGDFECSACGTMSSTLEELRTRYPEKVSLTFVHFPLNMHRFAIPAAHAAECAAEQGKFESMYKALYTQQSNFGLKPWSQYAIEAQVPDLFAFDACIGRDEIPSIVASGKQIATKLELIGTPTIMINGWQMGSPPNLELLELMVEDVLKGRSPVASLPQPQKGLFSWIR